MNAFIVGPRILEVDEEEEVKKATVPATASELFGLVGVDVVEAPIPEVLGAEHASEISFH